MYYLCWNVVKHNQCHELATFIVIAPGCAFSVVKSLFFDCFVPAVRVVSVETVARQVDGAGDALQFVPTTFIWNSVDGQLLLLLILLLLQHSEQQLAERLRWLGCSLDERYDFFQRIADEW
jgi:hypothetical protein